MNHFSSSLISVVIPAHNSEKTIERCVLSISNSNYRDIEIIVVNDNSTDNTASIINRLSEKDNRIKIFSTNEINKGASSARNIGINVAQSEYITFVDSDDYVSPDIYMKVSLVISKHNPDLIDFNHYYVEGEIINQQKKNNVLKDQLLDRVYIEQNIIPAVINVVNKKDYFIENYIWNKIYKRNIITSHNITFDCKKKKWNDKPFIAKYLKYTRSFFSLSDYGYYYVNTSNSLSKTPDPYLLKTVANSYEEYIELYADMYNFEATYPIDYYCKRFMDVTIKQVEALGKDNTLFIDSIKEVYSRDSVQKLFSLFNPTSCSEKDMKRIVTSRNLSELISFAEKEIRKKQIISNYDKISSFVRKCVNYLFIHILKREF